MRSIILFLLFFLGVNFLFAGAKTTDEGILFYYNDDSAAQVAIAGSFNEWNTTANYLQKDETGKWFTIIELEPGEYQYKLVVDGNWMLDPDNPQQKEDGYGGFNSLVIVGEKGKRVTTSSIQPPKSEGIKTSLNPKLYFDGRYYTKSIFINNENDRYMLEKPLHDINLGMKIKLNQHAHAYTVMNINNISEGSDMGKTHLNFKRSLLSLDTDYFNISTFDKYGFIVFDDPLHIVGDMGRYHYDFGYEQMGIFTRSKIPEFTCPLTKLALAPKFLFLYTDQVGDDDADIFAGRGKIQTKIANNRISFGFSEYIARLPISSNSSQEHVSSEADIHISHDLKNPGWADPMVFSLQGEYYYFTNTDKDSINSKWLDGNRIYVGFEVKFPAALQVGGNFQRNLLHFEEDIAKNSYSIFANFEMPRFFADANLSFWTNEFPDSLVGWNNYYKYLEKTDGNGRWFFEDQTYSNLPFAKYTLLGYDTGLLWDFNFKFDIPVPKDNLALTSSYKIAQLDFQYEPRYVETVSAITWQISEHWEFYSNTRIPIYNDSFLGIVTDFENEDDIFIDNYTSITYKLRDNVEISLGWGVNPLTLNNITDEFYEGGREQFMNSIVPLENYLANNYKGLGDKLREVEEKLMNEQRIGLEAVVKF